MGMAGTTVVDAAWPLILPEPEVDLYYILYIDKVTAMLTIAIFAITAKESAYAIILDLMIQLIEDRSHVAFMMLLGAVYIEILQPYNLALGIRQLLAHIAVKEQLGVGIGIQGILALVPLPEAVLAAAIGGGGGSIQERNAVVHAEMQHSLGILIIGFHHVVHIVLHSIGAGPLMEDHIHISAVEIIIQDSLQKGILVHVIHKLQATKISIALILLLAVIQIIHNENIGTSLTI